MATSHVLREEIKKRLGLLGEKKLQNILDVVIASVTEKRKKLTLIPTILVFNPGTDFLFLSYDPYEEKFNEVTFPSDKSKKISDVRVLSPTSFIFATGDMIKSYDLVSKKISTVTSVYELEEIYITYPGRYFLRSTPSKQQRIFSRLELVEGSWEITRLKFFDRGDELALKEVYQFHELSTDKVVIVDDEDTDLFVQRKPNEYHYSKTLGKAFSIANKPLFSDSLLAWSSYETNQIIYSNGETSDVIIESDTELERFEPVFLSENVIAERGHLSRENQVLQKVLRIFDRQGTSENFTNTQAITDISSNLIALIALDAHHIAAFGSGRDGHLKILERYEDDTEFVVEFEFPYLTKEDRSLHALPALPAVRTKVVKRLLPLLPLPQDLVALTVNFL